nr:hypothetical protein CFP56_56597 [Quercus suber]
MAEDFDLAIDDAVERLHHLDLPLQHMEVFNDMIRNHAFRSQLMDGNIKIEEIVERTTAVLKAALFDIREGAKASQDLSRYLKLPADKNSLIETGSDHKRDGKAGAYSERLMTIKGNGKTPSRQIEPTTNSDEWVELKSNQHDFDKENAEFPYPPRNDSIGEAPVRWRSLEPFVETRLRGEVCRSYSCFNQHSST